MKKVVKEVEAVEEVKSPDFTKVTYSIEQINSLMQYLVERPFREVSEILEVLKTKGELS